MHGPTIRVKLFSNLKKFLINPLSASVACCCANQLNGFYIMATLAFNGLNETSQALTICTYRTESQSYSVISFVKLLATYC